MTVNIDNEFEEAISIDYNKIINDIVEAALDYEKCPYETEVNVVLTNNKEIQKMNNEFRDINKATDVLSFPMLEYEKPANFSFVEKNEMDYFNLETGELMLGDIVVSMDKVYEQAKEYGHSNERELAFLIAHSMLHLCGYDHMEDEERKVMELKQEEILKNKNYTREI